MKTSTKPTRSSGAAWDLNATTTVPGYVEMATETETVQGILENVAVSPKSLAAKLIVYGGDYEVSIDNATGPINLDFALGNIFDINAVGNIGPFTEINVTQSRMGSIRIVNTTLSQITITWTGIFIPAGTSSTLAASGILWAPLGAML